MKRPPIALASVVMLGALVFSDGAALAQPAAPAIPPKLTVMPAAEVNKQLVLEIVNQLRNAIRSGDVAAAERVLSPNVTIYEQGHIESSRAEYMAHHFKEDAAYAKVVPSTVVAAKAEIDGSVAVVNATSTAQGVYKQKPVKSTTVETYVLRLRQGAWQIEHIHWSSAKALVLN
jgi:hypothetical protein